MSEEIQNTTVATVEVPDNSAPEVEAQPTRDDLRSKGWSAAELDSAEKRGMVRKKEEKPEEKEVKVAESAQKPDPAAVTEEKKPERRNSLPEFTFKTPEQEKAWLDAFGPGTEQRAMYYRMKNERDLRQKLGRELEQERAELQRLKKEFEESRRQPVHQEIDESGQVIDPEEKPLTIKQWKELQRQEAEERASKQREIEQRAASIDEANRSHEEYARAILPDFDESVKLAGEIAAKFKTEPEFLDPLTRKEARLLMQQFSEAVEKADRLDPENDLTPAEIAYRLGRLHPRYGEKANGQRAEQNDGKLPEKVNGGLTPEQMKRLENNTQRRASSASLTGGSGRKTVSPDDVTADDLNRMTSAQRSAFREKHRDRYEKLLRG